MDLEGFAKEHEEKIEAKVKPIFDKIPTVSDYQKRKLYVELYKVIDQFLNSGEYFNCSYKYVSNLILRFLSVAFYSKTSKERFLCNLLVNGWKKFCDQWWSNKPEEMIFKENRY